MNSKERVLKALRREGVPDRVPLQFDLCRPLLEGFSQKYGIPLHYSPSYYVDLTYRTSANELRTAMGSDSVVVGGGLPAGYSHPKTEDGCSHILSDAEALCSRVGVVAAGRLVSSGRVSELVTFDSQGWEAVVDGLPASVVVRLAGTVRRSERIAEGRYALEFPSDHLPERVLPDLMAAGGRVLSVNPVRKSLEDVFVQQVAAAGTRRVES